MLKNRKIFRSRLRRSQLLLLFQGNRAGGPEKVPGVLNGDPTRKCLAPPHAPVVKNPGYATDWQIQTRVNVKSTCH